MEAYGDSLTAGFLSNTRLNGGHTLESLSRIITDLMTFLITGERGYVKAHEHTELAWPAFLAGLLQAKGPPIDVRNYAISGSWTYDLVDQVTSAATSPGPTSAFFNVGFNDLCSTPLTPAELGDEFEVEYDRALAKWDATHQNSTAYLVPITDAEKMFEILKGQVWYAGSKRPFTCEDAWRKYFPYCSSFQRKLLSGTLHDYLSPRREAMNQRLGVIAAKWSKQSARNRFVHLAGSHDERLMPHHFAVDCYHLSPEGGQAVAQSLFEAIPAH
jgi:lysophospholipase L1-like esterase